jgi:hypothetical protein
MAALLRRLRERGFHHRLAAAQGPDFAKSMLAQVRERLSALEETVVRAELLPRAARLAS